MSILKKPSESILSDFADIASARLDMESISSGLARSQASSPARDLTAPITLIKSSSSMGDGFAMKGLRVKLYSTKPLCSKIFNTLRSRVLLILRMDARFRSGTGAWLELFEQNQFSKSSSGFLSE